MTLWNSLNPWELCTLPLGNSEPCRKSSSSSCLGQPLSQPPSREHLTEGNCGIVASTHPFDAAVSPLALFPLLAAPISSLHGGGHLVTGSLHHAATSLSPEPRSLPGQGLPVGWSRLSPNLPPGFPKCWSSGTHVQVRRAQTSGRVLGVSFGERKQRDSADWSSRGESAQNTGHGGVPLLG